MGKYKNYFCWPIPDMLLTVGVVMTILNILMTIFGFMNFIRIINDDSEGLSVGMSVVTMFGVTIYGATTFFSLCICCYNKSPELPKFLVLYSVFLVLIIVFSIIDVIHKLQIDFSLVLPYIIYGWVAAFCLFIVLIARQDAIEENLEAHDQFNSGQARIMHGAGTDGLPKYPVSIQIQKVDD